MNNPSAPLLSVRDGHKSFGATQALRGLDLDVFAGEALAVMGPSGSGKSTLLHALAGVLTLERGSVMYADPLRPASPLDLTTMNQNARSDLRLREFGFVFQYGQLLPELCAVDNVSMPLLLAGVKRREALARSADLLERIGIGDKRDVLPHQLSGGQAQRVAIARAMVNKPVVLFADEPTGSLDSLASETVLTLMLELVRESATTIVMITHDPRTAAYADREVVVRDGKVATNAWART